LAADHLASAKGEIHAGDGMHLLAAGAVEGLRGHPARRPAGRYRQAWDPQ
jgi:hypothetical protein